jgi:hypothetical protein
MRYVVGMAIAFAVAAAAPAYADTYDSAMNLKLTMGAQKAPSATLLDKKLTSEIENKDLVGTLEVNDLAMLAGAGAGGTSPIVAALVAFIVGLGIGHLIAGDPGWWTWLLIDLIMWVVYVVLWVVAAASIVAGGSLGFLMYIGWLLLFGTRIWQTWSAYSYASGTAVAAPAMSSNDVLAPTSKSFSGSFNVMSFSF